VVFVLLNISFPLMWEKYAENEQLQALWF